MYVYRYIENKEKEEEEPTYNVDQSQYQKPNQQYKL